MFFLVLIICLFVFLFSLYVLGKDDYLFIRKNFSLEHLFDYALVGLFFGIIFARFLWGGFRSGIEKGFLPHLFSPNDAGISLAAIVIGSMLIIYCLSKYRKLPTWRLFDFFSLAFLPTFCFGYLASSLFVKKSEIFYYIAPAICYLGLSILFWKVLYPRLIAGRLKNGSLSCLFLEIFSLTSFILLFAYQYLHLSVRLEAAYVISFIIIWASLIFLLRN